jgi:hypothetical protein
MMMVRKDVFRILAILITVAVALAFSAPLDAHAADKKSGNAYAKSIKTNAGKLSPKFNKNKNSYKINLTAAKSSAKVTLTGAHKKAKIYVKVDGGKYKLVKGSKAQKVVKVSQGKSKKVYFKIVAENKKTKKVYKVTVTRAARAPSNTTPAPAPTPGLTETPADTGATPTSDAAPTPTPADMSTSPAPDPAATPPDTPAPPADPAPTLPAPTYNSSGTTVTADSVRLEWPPVADAEGYEVQRATSEDGPYAVVGTTEEPAFTDENLEDNTDYFYKVRAYATADGNRYYGEFGEVQKVTTLVKEPQIAFSARNPILEYLYRNGFFYGSRINFNLIVIDDAGYTEIEIVETSGGTKNGRTKYITQSRTIQIDGPGTYTLSQEMWNGYSGYADQGSFTYSVSAFGKSYSTNFTGCYSAYNGEWDHYFGMK